MTGARDEAIPETLDDFLAGVERRAFVVARLATRDEQAALDLVQESMIALVKHYRTEPPSTWAPRFHRILQNRIRDWARRRSVRRRVLSWIGRGDDDRDPIESAPDPSFSGPADEADRRDVRRDVTAALADLPMRQQQAFVLRAWEGLDVADTAAAMGIGQGSVKTHYHRAVQFLRTRLEEHRR